jgi:hypothetical protein
MIGAKAAADVIALDAGDPQAGDAEIARDLMRARGRRAWVGGTHVRDDCRSRGPTNRQQCTHTPVEQVIVAASWIGQPIAVSKSDGALAETFQHHHVKFAALHQIDGRIEPVGGKACAGTNSKYGVSFGHKGLCLVGGAFGAKW